MLESSGKIAILRGLAVSVAAAALVIAVQCLGDSASAWAVETGRFVEKNGESIFVEDQDPSVRLLLEQAHVAFVPGNDFGFSDHVRLSFATSTDNINKGLDRLAAFVG